MPTTKLTFKIHSLLMASFNKQLRELHIVRDGFLNDMIRVETRHLAEDMEGKRLSNEARSFVAGSLKRLGTTTVNVVVDQEVAKSLNDIVERHNLVRDAFLNRLIMFLRGSPALLNYLEIPQKVIGRNFDSIVEPMPTSPLKAIEEAQSDPLYYIRTSVRERDQTGLYLVPLPRQYLGFSCFLDDYLVPGTKAKKDFDATLKELDDFETGAFKKAKVGVVAK